MSLKDAAHPLNEHLKSATKASVKHYIVVFIVKFQIIKLQKYVKPTNCVKAITLDKRLLETTSLKRYTYG